MWDHAVQYFIVEIESTEVLPNYPGFTFLFATSLSDTLHGISTSDENVRYGSAPTYVLSLSLILPNTIHKGIAC